MTPVRVLVIDDEIKLVRSISFALRQAGIECLQAYSGAQGIQIAERQKPDLVLLDVKMPGAPGLDVLQALRETGFDSPVVMMSALDATKDAVRAVKLGAIDYLSKPFDIDDLIQLIHEAVTHRTPLRDEKRVQAHQIEEAMLLGNSHVIANLRAQLDRVAASNSRCATLLGEVGTGKAAVARELHQRSRGGDAPLIEINCATLAPDQAEAEMFGQEASPNGGLPRRGLIEIADGGTLFLHEIEALPIAIQTRLMVFLETGALRPVSAQNSRVVDVRLIVSSHTDFAAALAKDRLRPDLYLKLKALPLVVPTLRERREDIELLTQCFMRSIAQQTGHRPVRLTPTCLKRMKAYDWPGNVRELKNLIERLMVLHPGEIIDETALPDEIRNLEIRQAESIEDQIRNVERDLVLEALAKARGRKGLAAERLRISRHALKRKLQRLGLP